MALAGTVALPSPFPASGAVSIVAIPEDGDCEMFIKVVQVVSLKRIITRLVRPQDIRALRAPANGTRLGGPETWPIRLPKVIGPEIAALEQDIRRILEQSGARSEVAVPWYPAAIVYVPEMAPVLHRLEIGLTAAISAEHPVHLGGGGSCCDAAARPSDA
jgi:hypothetical protein